MEIIISIDGLLTNGRACSNQHISSSVNEVSDSSYIQRTTKFWN